MRQHGLLARTDALGAGLSPRQVEVRLARGSWGLVTRGVYRIAGTPGGWRHHAMVACLAAGNAAVASHLTAAALHGWERAPVLPHVSVPPSSSARTPLGRVHRSPIPPVDRNRVDGIPCTSASRTLVDCAALIERARLEAMVDDALCAGRASPESIGECLDRAGRKGRRGTWLLAAALEVWVEDIEPGSPAEVRFLRRLEEWGVFDAVTQYEVRDGAGRLVGRLDVAIPGRLHGFEYDSDRYHGPRSWARDESRHGALTALGWRIDHVSKRDLLPSATRIPGLLAHRAA